MKFFYEDKASSIQTGYGSRLEFGAHLHGHVELVYMMEGKSRVYIESKPYDFSQGDILVIFPNQIHQYERIASERYVLSIFPTELVPEYASELQKMQPKHPVLKASPKTRELFHLFDKIVVEAHRSPMRANIIRGCYLILMGEILDLLPLTDLKSGDADTIKKIIHYCEQNYRQDLSLERLSNDLYTNKYYISHLFSKKLRMGFCEYLGMLRISHAYSLLSSTDKTITQIAEEVGISTTRTFNRLFLKHTGMTPREYRNKQDTLPIKKS